MSNYIYGVITGIITAALVFEYGEPWLIFAFKASVGIGVIAIFIAIATASWSAWRDREAFDKRQKEIDTLFLKSCRKLENKEALMKENVRAELNAARNSWARERSSLIEKNERLLNINNRLVDALRSKWGRHISNVAKNNPARAKRMNKKAEKILRANNAQRYPHENGTSGLT